MSSMAQIHVIIHTNSVISQCLQCLSCHIYKNEIQKHQTIINNQMGTMFILKTGSMLNIYIK